MRQPISGSTRVVLRSPCSHVAPFFVLHVPTPRPRKPLKTTSWPVTSSVEANAPMAPSRQINRPKIRTVRRPIFAAQMRLDRYFWDNAAAFTVGAKDLVLCPKTISRRALAPGFPRKPAASAVRLIVMARFGTKPSRFTWPENSLTIFPTQSLLLRHRLPGFSGT